ncbi:CHAT domain-containing protein [Streptomyces luteolifulvus]|uniref:CHAT domain-containing protein n=1 Tax=Streptomyces luteolifulvus TaxID=2615112 RepID=A0A6H9URQ0_9ACTN|nr:CHAT domain-containing protein [Streptomyces luteolifulvus]KAB1141121.1 CHAT domain-containing protein [Streptomyces luteolifulvus]
MDTDDALTQVVTAVLEGRLAFQAATDRLRTAPGGRTAAFYEQRLREVQRLIGSMTTASSVLHVATMTDLAHAAAEPLSPRIQGCVLFSGALKLITMGAGDSALARLDRAVALLDEEEEEQERALRAHGLRLMALRRTRQYQTFEQYCPDVIEKAEQLGDPEVLCVALHEKAQVLAQLGRPTEACEAAGTAHRIFDEALRHREPMPYDHMTFVYEHGLIYRQAARFDEALGALEAARSLALAEGDARFAAWVLSEIGMTWDLLRDQARATHFLQGAAKEAEKVGRHNWALHWRQQLPDDDKDEDTFTLWHRACALVARHPERATEAVLLLRQCIVEARRDRQHGMEAVARNSLGVALSMAGQPVQAELAMRVAITTALRHGELLRVVQFRTNLASLLISRGRVDEALAEIGPAIDIGERLRDTATTTEFRQSVAAALSSAYDAAVFTSAVYYQPGRWQTEAGSYPVGLEPRPGVLLELGQRARAAVVTEALRLGQTVDKGSAAELVRPVLALRAAEVDVELAAAEYRTLTGPIAERNRAATELEATAARLGTSLSVRSAPVPLEELAAALAPGEVLVDLLSVDEGVAITCLVGDGSATAELTGWNAKERRRLLLRLQRTRREYLAACPEDIEETRTAADEAVSALSRVLLDPIAELIRQLKLERPTRLFVCPKNELFHLPYWGLESLLHQCAVSVLPTSGALPLLRARHRDGRRPWLAVADPSRTLPYVPLDLPTRLDYAPCAAEAEALLAALPSAGRVHFACHGHFNPGSVHRSGLEVSRRGQHDPLAAPHPSGASGMELFTAAQITGRLHLPHCALVVLAACDSGLPRLHAASEFTSLPGAFLIAGARNVVASLWPAHDGASALLMRSFYEAGPERPSTALVTARRRLATMPRTEACDLLRTSRLPEGDPPFGNSVYTDCFQHYGVD